MASTYLATWVLAMMLSGDPLSFEYPGQVNAQGQAHFVLVANEDMKDLEIVITGDGQTIRKHLPALAAGKRHEIRWTQQSQQARYDLEITGKGVEALFAFEIEKSAPAGKIGKLQVKSSRDDIVKRNRATYVTSFPLAKYEYAVYDADGDAVARGTVDEPVPAGGEFTITWNAPTEVFMIFVRGEDEYGRFTEYKLVPWSVEIPHTEINFDTGKADIKNDEATKLDEAVAVAFHELDAIERVNEAVKANIAPRLYIVGYTDSVGSTASNDRLSLNRARSIAEYFRDAGFWAPIYYAGMGERALRVETGDNVDEVRNRRALYLIGVQNPPAGGQIPARWHKLTNGRARPAGFELPPLPERWANYREKSESAGTTNESSEAKPTGELAAVTGTDASSAEREPLEDSREPATFPTDEQPPAVEGKPGATAKGCSVTGSTSSLGLLGLLGWVTRRRRRA